MDPENVSASTNRENRPKPIPARFWQGAGTYRQWRRDSANLLSGLRFDEYFTRTASSTTSSFLTDGLGSTIGLVSANNGPIATNYTYQPFGAAITGGTANSNPYEFTGRENDGTGMYFYQALY
jgi:hypothetical protein